MIKTAGSAHHDEQRTHRVSASCHAAPVGRRNALLSCIWEQSTEQGRPHLAQGVLEVGVDGVFSNAGAQLVVVHLQPHLYSVQDDGASSTEWEIPMMQQQECSSRQRLHGAYHFMIQIPHA